MVSPQAGAIVRPGDDDSPLSVTSNVLGIFTFAFAIIFGGWLRYHQWNTAEKEFAEFEKYLEVHTVELAWMRQLLAQGRNRPFTRPALPQGPSFHYTHSSPYKRQPKFYSNRNSEEFPHETQAPNALGAAKSAQARKRIKRAGNYVVRKIREDNAKKEKAIAALRYSIQMQKKDANRQCRKTEDSMFNNILRVLGDLDKELQEIVNKVREIEPESNVLVTENGYGLTKGTPLSNLPLQAGHSRRNSGVRAGSSKPGAIHREFVAPPPPQRAGSKTAPTPLTGPAIHRASDVLASSWPLTKRAISTPEHRVGNIQLPVIQIKSGRNGHIGNGLAQTTSNLTAEPDTEGPMLRSSCFDRAAAYLLQKYPKSWMAKRIISMNWLRVRERAFELRKQRDIQWNRVHASQLALLSRRIEDQDEHIEMLDEHMTLQFRLVSSAILTYQGNERDDGRKR